VSVPYPILDVQFFSHSGSGGPSGAGHGLGERRSFGPS